MIELYTEEDDTPFQNTVVFEKLHDPILRWRKKDREAFFKYYDGKALWLAVNGLLIGELLWEDVEELETSKKTAHIVSFSVRKSHQGRGYGVLLKQVLYNILKNKGYYYVTGNARHGKSWSISKKLGAKEINLINNYHKTGKKYHYYKQKL